MLNENIPNLLLALNACTQHPLLGLLWAIGQKYTSGAAMESITQPQYLEKLESVMEVTHHMT